MVDGDGEGVRAAKPWFNFRRHLWWRCCAVERADQKSCSKRRRSHERRSLFQENSRNWLLVLIRGPSACNPWKLAAVLVGVFNPLKPTLSVTRRLSVSSKGDCVSKRCLRKDRRNSRRIIATTNKSYIDSLCYTSLVPCQRRNAWGRIGGVLSEISPT